jgi:hypothetical protein
MMRRSKHRPYGYLLLQVIMDCRVKPGNDRVDWKFAFRGAETRCGPNYAPRARNTDSIDTRDQGAVRSRNAA